MAAWTAVDGCGGKWVGRIARTAVAGVVEMGGEKKPLVISELGCVDGCGREIGAENCADGCGRCGCKGVAGNLFGTYSTKPIPEIDVSANSSGLLVDLFRMSILS